MAENQWVLGFETIEAKDVPLVGGKNASLGEMISKLEEKGIRVPGGFATTSNAYWEFIHFNQLREPIEEELRSLKNKQKGLNAVGKTIRRLIQNGKFPDPLEKAIVLAYRNLSKRYQKKELDVAVRSSATAEDLPNASFAGQQESFLNIQGENELLQACRKCFASLFTDRAITYRQIKGFEHMKVALSIGIQKMIRSDQSGAGVMFSLDPESGFPHVVTINAAWGLGENIVKGSVTPDEAAVFKPLLNDRNFQPIIHKTLGDKRIKMIYSRDGTHTTENIETTSKERNQFVINDDEILQLARWAMTLEEHYGRPMDIEWAKDGAHGDLYIVQARPETVHSQIKASVLKNYKLMEKGKKILTGVSVGEAIASGAVCLIESPDQIQEFKEGAILVTEMTDPDWVPIMKRASGIITDQGGRTCHAAIISRELGLPAIVGTGKGTHVLQSGQHITLSCAEGDKGMVYEGKLKFVSEDVELNDIPETKTPIMLNIASPQAAFHWWKLPCKGVGLARMEFIIDNIIKIHPMALVNFSQLKDRKVRKEIREMTRGYQDRKEYFIDQLARGISKIAASQFPDPVIVRMSDFKTNEYANLIGGKDFEPKEENPMLGFRGASRYYSPLYREGFSLECKAIKKVRERIGLSNVVIMIPFCRTLEEADRVLEVLGENGLKRGENGLEVYVMCEIPSNVILAEQFSDRFDGFSIGTNDLTQLLLGIDRDSALLADLFDERNPAVKAMIQEVIVKAHKKGRKVGICGQAPSDYPEFAEFLVKAGIDSISLNPDSVVAVKQRLAKMESNLKS